MNLLAPELAWGSFTIATSLICGVVDIPSHPTVAGDDAGLTPVFLHCNRRRGWHRRAFKKASAPPSHRESTNLPAPLSTFWLIAFWLRSSGQLESSPSQREGRRLFPSVRAHEQNRSEEIIALLEILPKKKRSHWKRASLSSPLIHKMLIKHPYEKKEEAKSFGGSRSVSWVIMKLNAL